MKALVAYFSASGVTKVAAEKLAQAAGADVFEIVPEELYTAADLNWMDKKSRSSVEMADLSSRPAVKSVVDDMNKYDIIFVGFPVWWGREPSVVDTFLEAYDLTGKTIAPFATSGGSPIDGSVKNIKAVVGDKATVVGGKMIKAATGEEELKIWSEVLGC